ncbi:MAG: nuclear transport factor 2 family protein [Acidimicrobiales bacterium]
MAGIEVLRTMFTEVVEAKDVAQAGRFYHPDFEMTSNGITQAYDAFVAGHERVYATPISYSIRYDEDAWVDAGDRIAGRVWITITRPGDDPVTIEVVLIATLVDGLIHRLWELTWPDWSKEPALDDYG